MDIISRTAAGLPSPSGLTRRINPWAGITAHHTGGNVTTWRAIHDWQTSGRPEASQLAYIGYSYGILNGRVTELRGWDYRPAGDHENSRIQVVFMGTFDKHLPGAADLKAFLDFCAYAEERAGKKLPVTPHRDVWPSGHRYDTDCPGDALFAWLTHGMPLGADGEDDMRMVIAHDKLTDRYYLCNGMTYREISGTAEQIKTQITDLHYLSDLGIIGPIYKGTASGAIEGVWQNLSPAFGVREASAVDPDELAAAVVEQLPPSATALDIAKALVAELAK